MSNVSYGQEKERDRIAHYTQTGWHLLFRAIRTKYQREDIGGGWDLWLARNSYLSGMEWLFVSVGPYSERAEKLREAKEWLNKYDPGNNNIRYALDLYKPPHHEGRGKAKKWVPGVTWLSEMVTRDG